MTNSMDSDSEVDFEGHLGLVAGLPFDPFDGEPFEISVTSFAAFDPKGADQINAIRDGRLRTKKMNEFIQEAAKKSDPVLEAFAYGDKLKGSGISFFFGDENESIEEFIDDNKADMDRYLEKINRHAIGGFTFSSGDRSIKPSVLVEELIGHLEENYFNVDER